MSLLLFFFAWLDLFYRVKHKQELVGKSSAIPAKILAPEDIHIYEFPDVPQFPDTSRVAFVYPLKVCVLM